MITNPKYNEIMVRFYDAVYENMASVQDKSYYVNKLLNAGGPALEIGCGTGRVFTRALAQGADVYGIDQNELMLEKLRAKIDAKDFHRIELCDALQLNHKRKYKVIIAPFRMFQHLISIDEQLKVLENVKNCLDVEGEFIFDVFNPDLKFIQTGSEETLQFSGEYEPGKAIRRYHTIKPDLLNQVQNIRFRFEWDEDGETKHAEFSTPMRYFFRFELEHLIARSGLRLVSMFGDDKGSPFNVDSKNMICVCTK